MSSSLPLLAVLAIATLIGSVSADATSEKVVTVTRVSPARLFIHGSKELTVVVTPNDQISDTDFKSAKVLCLMKPKDSTDAALEIPGEFRVFETASEGGLLECVPPRIFSSAGTIEVNVKVTIGGTVIKSGAPKTFELAAPKTPDIAFINPDSGPVFGQTEVRLALREEPQGEFTCSFTDPADDKFKEIRPAVIKQGRMISCQTPPHPKPGAVKISVKNLDAPPSSNSFDFKYQEIVMNSGNVTQVFPAAGTASGGTQIQITGKGFGTEAGVSYMCIFVDQNGTGEKAEAALRISDSIIRCGTPPHPAGPVYLAVSKNGLPPSNAINFTFVGSAPGTTTPSGKINNIMPNEAPKTGGVDVIVFGMGFGTVTGAGDDFQCFFGDVDSPAIHLTPTTLRCPVPPTVDLKKDVTIDFCVQRNDLNRSNCVPFTYLAQIRTGNVLMIAPRQGPSSGGTDVDVRGRFAATGIYMCIFGNTTVQGWRMNPSLIRCTSPPFNTTEPGDMHTVPFHVRRADADEPNPENITFVYVNSASTAVAPFRLSFVTPPSSPLAGGGMVSVFSQALPKRELDTDSTFWRCNFNGTLVAATRISVNVVRCVVPVMTQAGYVDLTLVRNLNETSLPIKFTYIDEVKIMSKVEVQDIVPKRGGEDMRVVLRVSGLVTPSDPDSMFLACHFGETGMDAIALSPATKVSKDTYLCTVPPLPLDYKGDRKKVPVDLYINNQPSHNSKAVFEYVDNASADMLLNWDTAFVAQKTSPAMIVVISVAVYLVMTVLLGALVCFCRRLFVQKNYKSIERQMEEAEQELSLMRKRNSAPSAKDQLRRGKSDTVYESDIGLNSEIDLHA